MKKRNRRPRGNNDKRDVNAERQTLLRLLEARWFQQETKQSSETVAVNINGESNRNRSENGRNGNTQENNAKERTSLKTDDIWLPVIEAIVGGGLFSILYNICNDLSFHRLKLWCSILGLSAVEFAIAHLVFRARRDWLKRIGWIYAGVVSLQFLGGGISSYTWHPQVAATPVQPAAPQTNYVIATPTAIQPTWQPPEFFPDTTKVFVSFGGMQTWELVTRTTPVKMFAFDNDFSPIRYEIRDRRIWIEAVPVVVDKDYPTGFVVKSGNTNFFGDLPVGWDYNFNASAVEIVGPGNFLLLQIWYKTPAQVEIKGMFSFGPIGATLPTRAIAAYGGETRDGPIKKMMEYFKNEKPMFKYPGSLHRGELADTTGSAGPK